MARPFSYLVVRIELPVTLYVEMPVTLLDGCFEMLVTLFEVSVEMPVKFLDACVDIPVTLLEVCVEIPVTIPDACVDIPATLLEVCVEMQVTLLDTSRQRHDFFFKGEGASDCRLNDHHSHLPTNT